MRIVSYYTKDTPYEEEVKNLIASIPEGWESTIRAYPSRGSWILNCGIKPEFLLEMLEEYDEDLLFVDADAVIKSDIAFRLPKSVNLAVHRTRAGEILSGTIFFRRATQDLIKAWMHKQDQKLGIWDQRNLAEVIKELSYPFIYLPGSYVKIFDKPGLNPVIEHMQASRRLRRRVTERVMPDPKRIATISRKFGIRIKTAHNGTIWLPRANKKAEKKLSEEFTRLPNQLKWTPKAPVNYNIKKLYGKFPKYHCYLIGKGPSLDRINDLPLRDDDMVICINESIQRIDPLVAEKHRLFVMQQDAWLRESCVTRGSIILGHGCRYLYQEYNPRYILERGQVKGGITAIQAINLAKRMGVTSFTLIAFDAFAGNIDYADCVGYKASRGGAPERFYKHARKIKQALLETSLSWKVYPEET